MSKQRGLKVAPPAGTKVRLTGYFLKSTGQVTGGEGSSRWTVLEPGACGFPMCGCGTRGARTLAVNEAIDRVGYEDIISYRTDGRLMRHIALGNLEIVGAPPKAADMADDLGPIKVF